MRYILLNVFSFILLYSFMMVNGGTIPTANDYKINGLEKYGSKDEMYSGFMPLDLGDSNRLGNFFFWLVKQRNHDPTQPSSLIIWLNGGPGCSSMVGMMFENGPFTLQFGNVEKGEEKYDLKYNPYSWNEVADVIFVEQPLRTGYATAAHGTDQVRSEKQIGEDFRKFLLSLLQVFPEYKDVEIFLTGESYAGFYIPWIANTVIKYQMKESVFDSTFYRDTQSDHINLAGAAIGNGVLDYLYQEPSYAEYAYSHGFIPLAAKKKFDFEWTECLEKIQKSGKPLTRGSFDECAMMEKVLEAAGKPNEYNTATFNQYDNILKEDNPFNTFFQDPEIQTLLHVRGINLPGINFYPEHYEHISNITFHDWHPDMLNNMYYQPPFGWKVCNDEIDDAMNADHPVSAVPVLQFLTDFSTHYKVDKKHDKAHNNIRILLYSGEFDINCNTLGTLHTLEANVWRKRHWYDAHRSLWKYKNDVAGEYYTFDEIFSFLIVRNSGHLLPMDLPATALEMINKFIKKKTFADIMLPSESYYMDQVNMNVAKHNNDKFINGLSEFVLIFFFIIASVFGYIYYRHQFEKAEKDSSMPFGMQNPVLSVGNSSVSSGQYQRIPTRSLDEQLSASHDIEGVIRTRSSSSRQSSSRDLLQPQAQPQQQQQQQSQYYQQQ